MPACASDRRTEAIRVESESFFVPERSNPSREEYFFGYRIRISNEGEAPARLVSRSWIITDGLGDVEYVRGPGVVGEQPYLAAGETFEYSSACPLSTSFGVMEGEYTMERDDGTQFQATIGPFCLVNPHLRS
jgi:ApaG protein